MDQESNIAAVETLLTKAGISPTDIIQLLPVAAYICDADNGFLYCNEYGVQLLGRRPAVKEVFFKNHTGTIPQSETSLMPDDWQDIIQRPDQSTLVVKGSTRALKDVDGKLVAWLHCLRQVPKAVIPHTDKRMFSDADVNVELKRSEERYYKMIEEVEDYAILVMDRSGIIQNWNKGAEKIKGYHESEIIGQHFSLFYLPEDRDRKLPEKLIAEAIRTGKAVQEGWRMRKNGTRFWGSIVITALHDADQNVIGFSKVTRDLTEKKIAEDRIRQYSSELEFQNMELEQFAYAAAHDMKEPLRKVQFYNNYIFDNAAEGLPDKAREYLSRSINAASRMQGLIDDLLTYSKASSQSKETESTDLTTIVSEVLQGHNDTIEKTGAIIDVGPLPVMDIIPFQFSQLFDNLIGNALKYHHPERTPHITITAVKTQLHVGTDLKEGLDIPGYMIAVSDNGLGFDPDHAEKIFDVFQRLHTRSDIAGTGIGLAICKKIVLNHRGLIKARGIPGEGAVFEVYIPCQQF
jgi:PAS domain S-box-containing protein